MAYRRRRVGDCHHAGALLPLLLGGGFSWSGRPRSRPPRLPVHTISARWTGMGRVLCDLSRRSHHRSSRAFAALAANRRLLPDLRLCGSHSSAAQHRLLALPSDCPIPGFRVADRSLGLPHSASSDFIPLSLEKRIRTLIRQTEFGRTDWAAGSNSEG